jgi:hypothetical protein
MRRPFRGRFGRPPVPDPSPFVVGLGRSGTTLLRLMLDSHPQLTIPPETHFAVGVIRMYRNGDPTPEEAADYLSGLRRWGDFGIERDEILERLQASAADDAQTALRAFYEVYAAKQGKPRWGDKTPGYTQHMRRISRVLPEARFVHLIRDGRAVAFSRATTLTLQPVEIPKLAKRWRRRLTKAREQGAHLDHYLEVRYETLIRDPEPTLREICKFIELEWDPVLLDYHRRSGDRLSELDRDIPAWEGKLPRSASSRLALHEQATKPLDPGRIDRWREEMSDPDLEAVEAEAGELLVELGYELGR